MSLMPLKIGSRGSELALWQARHVASMIESVSGILPEIVVIKTTGDIILDRQLSEVGGKGLFVKEIEEALLRKEIDLAVHSMKDVPAFLPPGLTLAATLKREDPRDVFLSPHYPDIKSLPHKARVGTSSLRRLAQIREFRSDLEFIPLRGNVGTRIRKMEDGVVEAIILAGAGLLRLGHANRVREWISPQVLLPAIGQGALGLEIRTDDETTGTLIRSLSDESTHLSVAAERGVLQSLNGGCQVPIAAYAVWEKNRTLSLEGRVLDISGTRRIHARETRDIATIDDAYQMGMDLGNRLLADGAEEILNSILKKSS
ncbi:Porphobilinogen deaminase [Leptospirillum ferriphilum]|uniref:Porphobilinogen deaminase n=1 Tax=Leptospirillum ferriphilum TaxID=178606 RepID=A0A094W8R2_9BACT|nr:hydroxymethylbilane synthase [Leptospirillum ferriphilum]KGA93923.1 Porphobilinogen deaminase [Leptospirillum ferriphilum]